MDDSEELEAMETDKLLELGREVVLGWGIARYGGTRTKGYRLGLSSGSNGMVVDSLGEMERMRVAVERALLQEPPAEWVRDCRLLRHAVYDCRPLADFRWPGLDSAGIGATVDRLLIASALEFSGRASKKSRTSGHLSMDTSV